MIEVEDDFDENELPVGAHLLGRTTDGNCINACGESILLEDAIAAWQAPLADVFPGKRRPCAAQDWASSHTPSAPTHRSAVKIATTARAYTGIPRHQL